MDGYALLGILCFIYAIALFFMALKKPEKIWQMAKIRMFVKVMGEKGTVIFFYVFAGLMIALGIWLFQI